MPRSSLSRPRLSSDIDFVPDPSVSVFTDLMKNIWYMLCLSWFVRKPHADDLSSGLKHRFSKSSNSTHPADFKTSLHVSLAAMASTRPAYVAAALFTRANPLTFSRGLPSACMIMLVIISLMAESLRYNSR